jgi:phosphatidate cytidylyltransferase
VLHWRLSLGVFFIAVLALLFWFDIDADYPGILLFPLAILITPLAASEFIRLATFEQQQPAAWVVYVGSLLVVFATGIPHFWQNGLHNCPVGNLGWPLLAFTFAVILAIVGEALRYASGRAATINFGLSIYGIFYIGVLMSFIVQLRFVGGPEFKGLPLIAMLIVVKLCDIGAYTTGRVVGKHQLAPRISPGKTIEGVVGGLAFAIVGSYFALSILPQWISTPVPPLPWWAVIGYGLLVGGTGILGDLLESLLKRTAGRKDSSSWMPGFGGVLDLIDSPLLAGPIAYFAWIVSVP